MRSIPASEHRRLVRDDEDALVELAKVFGVGGSDWDLRGNRNDPDAPQVELLTTLNNTYVVSTKDIVFAPTAAGVRAQDAQWQYITQRAADIQQSDVLESVAEGVQFTVQTVDKVGNLTVGIAEKVR